VNNLLPKAEKKRAAIAFTLKLTWALHRYGFPAHRLEDVMGMMANRLQIPAQFFSVPTAVIAAFGDGVDQHTYLVRVEPGDVDLDKQTRLNDVAEAVGRGALTPDTGEEKVDEIVAAKPLYGPVLTTVCFGLASGIGARVFGGGWREAAISLVTGTLVGVQALVLSRSRRAVRLFEAVAALTASVMAALGVLLLGNVSTSIAVLGSLIVILPGFTVTVAMNELAARHLMSGTARMMGAFMVFLIMGLGVALGGHIATILPGKALAGPILLPDWTEYVAMVIGILAFSVIFRAPKRQILWVTLIGASSYTIARELVTIGGYDLSAGFAAFFLGIASNLYSRLSRKPSSIPLVPSLMMLVPGSIGFRSFFSLLEHNITSGIETAFRMGMVAIALVTGLLMANVVFPALPPRWVSPADSTPIRPIRGLNRDSFGTFLG